ncbi:MAG: NUDIX domain-containing protein [Patescibacteria group bacterium]|jgi:ADP-ribose pyrophosphatase YjhB (NUDIX family)
MKTKILVIGVVKKGDSVLMRKKPDGSLPYKETWYLFGGELSAGLSPEDVITQEVKAKTGIDIKISERLSWDTEIKKDVDGEEKHFIYLDTLCEYVGGKEKLSPGIQKLEWIPIGQLKDYDIVPPSRKLFIKLNYLER